MNNNDRVCRNRGGLNEDMIRRLLGQNQPGNPLDNAFTPGCGCGNPAPCGYPTPRRSLATVTPVPQTWEDIYDLQTALCEGTIFEQLNLQFTGRCRE